MKGVAPLQKPNREVWAKKITDEWGRAVESIIAVGRSLIAAKEELEHGEFLKMIEEELPFGRRTAHMLMSVASHPLLSNENHGSHLPCSWRTLYALSRLPDSLLRVSLDDGRIHANMQRSDVLALLADKPEPDPWDLDEALDRLVSGLRNVAAKWPTSDQAWDAFGTQLVELGQRALKKRSLGA